MRSTGAEPILPPHSEVASLDALYRLWTDAGLMDVETREIVAHRVFPSFDDYWTMAVSAPGIGQVLAKLGAQQLDHIRDSVRDSRSSGEFIVQGRAHAIRGRVPTWEIY